LTLQADLIEANKEFRAKQAAMADLLKDVDSLSGTKAADRASEIKQANDELSDLGEKRDALQGQVDEIDKARAAVKAGQRPVHRQVEPEIGYEPEEDESFTEGVKSVRELIRNTLDSHPGQKAAGRGLHGYRGDLGTLAVKTLITSADLTPLESRRPGVIPSAQEERTTADLMLQGTTTAQKLTYFEETTFTNAAVETDEAGLKQESALDFTLREDNVRKIATWVPVTDEMLEDVPTFESYLRERLGFMVKQREELQILRGAGTGVTIQGIMNRSGLATTVTGYAESTLDSLYHGITNVRVESFTEPTAFVMHPKDWSNVRLSKDKNENYLLGPATAEGPARVWGLEVRVTTNMLENTALVGAFRPHAQIFRRSGIDIAISTEHSDYFIYNKVAVRAEERIALAVYRPAAFCKIEAIVIGS
jgi:HK97 family phage major capsid protein